MRSRHRNAFTIVETVVALGLAALVIGGAWMLLTSGARQGKQTDIRLQGVKEGLLFVQRFENDLLRLYLDPTHEVTMAADRPGIEFFIFDPSASEVERGRVAVRRIAYYLDRTRGAIYRVEGDDRPRRLRGSYEELAFWRSPPHEPAPAPGSPPPPLALRGVLTYLVTCTPEAVLKLPPAERRPQDRTTFWGSVALTPATGGRLTPFWQPSPTARPTN